LEWSLALATQERGFSSSATSGKTGRDVFFRAPSRDPNEACFLGLFSTLEVLNASTQFKSLTDASRVGYKEFLHLELFQNKAIIVRLADVGPGKQRFRIVKNTLMETLI
jgi:hypothetical protein